MILYYTKQCSPSVYSEKIDEDCYFTETIDYEPSQRELDDALSEIIYDIYFKNNQLSPSEKGKFIRKIWNFITDIEFDYEPFREELTDYFRYDAFGDN